MYFQYFRGVQVTLSRLVRAITTFETNNSYYLFSNNTEMGPSRVSTVTPPFEDPCIIFKPLTTRGGAERYMASVAAALDAPLYTPYQTVSIDEHIDVIEFRDRDLSIRLIDHISTATANLLELENFEVPEKHDAVITSGGATKAVIHHPDQRRYHVLQMPPRWLYDLGPGKYAKTPPLFRGVKRMLQSYLRVHDRTTTMQIDDFVVPSEVIGRRLGTYYNREPSAVIYPPVDIDSYHHGSQEEFLLAIGRLSPEKRMDELVRTLNDTKYQIKIAGDGPERQELERIASDNVELLGYVTEEEKRDLLAHCDALVFNSDREAFGIVPIEAMASGKPVVGVNEGFTRFQIEPGRNGVVYERGSENFVSAVEKMYTTDWEPDEIQQTAQKYSAARFEEDWRLLLSEE